MHGAATYRLAPQQKGHAMARLIHWIADVIRDPDTEPVVHFHSGPESMPAVCYDARCGAPRLDVRTA